MGGLASQQEATQDPFPVSRVGATGETAEVAAEFAAAGPGQRRGERFQIPKPMRQTELVGGPGIDEGRRLENGRGIVPDDQLDLLQAALPEASEQLDVGLGGLGRGRPPLQNLEGAVGADAHGHPQHPGLGGAIHPAAPQAKHANLLEGSPQRLPALAGCVAPPVDLLPLLAQLGYAAIPFGFQQPFSGSSQLLQELVPHLIPTLLHHFLQ